MHFMSTIVHINPRGTLTIPKELRDKFGLGVQVILEETDDGLVLRPAATYPMEIYTKERLEEFAAEEAKLAKYHLK